MKTVLVLLANVALTFITPACHTEPQPAQTQSTADYDTTNPQQLALALSAAAAARTRVRVIYDGTYRAIPYPGGDVSNSRGVCSDVIIRAYRKLGLDLQQLVHEDMNRAFDEYPNRWGLSRPDPNIDHRRVPNLERFFERHGTTLSRSKQANYQPGDVVSWRLPHGAPHIGIVHSSRSPDGERPLVVHNIGLGPVLDDSLFRYKIAGHFRFPGTTTSAPAAVEQAAAERHLP